METIEPVSPAVSAGGTRGRKALRAAFFSVKLAVALPLLWWALLPRLGPLEWSLFILLGGMFSYLAAPLLAVGNAVWVAGRFDWVTETAPGASGRVVSLVPPPDTLSLVWP
jgi:hypothetical protein